MLLELFLFGFVFGAGVTAYIGYHYFLKPMKTLEEKIISLQDEKINQFK